MRIWRWDSVFESHSGTTHTANEWWHGIPVGTEGVVESVRSNGNLFVKWDNGEKSTDLNNWSDAATIVSRQVCTFCFLNLFKARVKMLN